MKKDLNKYATKIIVATLVLGGAINFFATPYVFGGFLMLPVFDVVRLILIILFFLELNILGVRQLSKVDRILIGLFTVIYFSEFFYRDGRIQFLVLLVWFLLALYQQLTDYFKNYYPNDKTSYNMNRLGYLTAYGVLFLILPMADMRLFQDGLMMLISLGVSVIVTTGEVIVLVKKSFSTKELLAAGFSTLLLGVLAVFFLISGLNYALDTSDPEEYYVEIVDLDVDTGGRHTTYEVYFFLHGEKQYVGVSKSEYYDLSVGDPFTVQVYQGFLGFEYLTSE